MNPYGRFPVGCRGSERDCGRRPRDRNPCQARRRGPDTFRTSEGIMNQAIDEITVGKIVVADFRTAGVFEQFGIDFCCGGRQSVAEACEAAAVDPEVVVEALRALPPADAHDDGDVTRWPLDRLID